MKLFSKEGMYTWFITEGYLYDWIVTGKKKMVQPLHWELPGFLLTALCTRTIPLPRPSRAPHYHQLDGAIGRYKAHDAFLHAWGPDVELP